MARVGLSTTNWRHGMTLELTDAGVSPGFITASGVTAIGVTASGVTASGVTAIGPVAGS
jgi:hypothetical protein